MAWRETIYVQFPDETAARGLATSLGVDFPQDGRVPSGSQNYAMHAPMQAPWIDPPEFNEAGEEIEIGVPEPGYWAMLRLNDEYAGYDALMSAIEEAGVRRTLEAPPVVWA